MTQQQKNIHKSLINLSARLCKKGKKQRSPYSFTVSFKPIFWIKSMSQWLGEGCLIDGALFQIGYRGDVKGMLTQ